MSDDFSEFWNREDEISCSEEDISESDDSFEDVKNLTRSKIPSSSGLNEKIEFLQREEDNYYLNRKPEKETSKPQKNAISDAMREASKQRLLNALNQTQHRISDLKIDLEASATFLENECYKKYGKTGKTFYFSQVASTVRWLSITKSDELKDRIKTNIGPNTENVIPERVTTSISRDPRPIEVNSNEIYCSHSSETAARTTLLGQSSPQNIKLPSIPSFSEFINSKRKDDNKSNRPDKRSRLQ